MGDRIHLSLDDDAQALLEELEDDIENIYDSKSAFFKQKLMEYDRTSKLQAKKDLIETRIEVLQEEIEDLKLQKEGIETKLEELTADTEETGQEQGQIEDEEFWEDTVKLIAVRTDRSDLKKIQDRYNKYLEPRFKLYKNRFTDSIGLQDFKQRLLDEMKEKGYEEKAEVLA